jgi:hypothetical protein
MLSGGTNLEKGERWPGKVGGGDREKNGAARRDGTW